MHKIEFLLWVSLLMTLIQGPTFPPPRHFGNFYNSNWAQLVEFLPFSGSMLDHRNVVLTWSWFPKAFYLWITFGLASSFTLDFVVDYLVNPTVFSDVCFHQQHLRAIILQSLDFKACIRCDSNTSHLLPLC